MIAFFERDKGQLGGLKDVTSNSCKLRSRASIAMPVLSIMPPGSIGVFLREPLSGTMTASELTVP